MPHSAKWREFLSKCINDTHERQRIANELGVSIVTLSRWANGTSNPRPQNLRHLLRALPQHRAHLLELLSEEFPDIVQSIGDDQEDAPQEIPVELYVHVMHVYTTVTKVQRFWALSNFILQQALDQLDPNHLGLAVTLVQCMPSSKQGIIRSLRERVGHGTPPWGISLEQQAILLGNESMAGYTVMNGRPLIRQNQNEHQGMFPAHWVEWEVSAAAYPIQRAGVVAGSFVVSSRQPDYFVPFRIKLIEQYSELLTLVFEQEEFYRTDIVNLREMPLYSLQREYLSSLHERATKIMNEAVQKNEVMSITVATELAWQQIEELFLEQGSLI
ncbi:MAG: hypothetical protein NVS4B11_10520 [Ktedonobacteraceae bacterium]